MSRHLLTEPLRHLSGEARDVRVLDPSRPRQIDDELLRDPTGAARQEHDAIAEAGRLADVVRHEQDCLLRRLPDPLELVMEDVAGHRVELPLRLRKVPAPARRARVGELLEMVQLGAFARRQPHELSGGMRQRVALARALAQDAEVLLMDEPFGALDAMTRDILHDELEQIWQATGRTILFVTHNVREAARLGDRIVLLTSRPGRVAEQFPVGIARPRRIEDPDVSSLARHVTARLRAEVARHGR